MSNHSDSPAKYDGDRDRLEVTTFYALPRPMQIEATSKGLVVEVLRRLIDARDTIDNVELFVKMAPER